MVQSDNATEPYGDHAGVRDREPEVRGRDGLPSADHEPDTLAGVGRPHRARGLDVA